MCFFLSFYYKYLSHLKTDKCNSIQVKLRNKSYIGRHFGVLYTVVD